MNMRRATAARGRSRGDGSVVKVHVRINGVDQGMLLQVREPGSPVLLFVHGGPGMPEHWLTGRYPTRLHEAFTVAWWEQRGAGMSYRRGIPPRSMTVAQFVADVLAVAGHLRDRFGADRVHLMGHSWGSFIGLQAAAQAPHLFCSYIGMAQVTHQLASEQLAHRDMVEQLRARGDRRMVRRLEGAPVTGEIPLPRRYERLRDPAMHRIGVGTTHDMRSVLTGIVLPTWTTPDYTLTEKAALWRGRRFSRQFGLWEQMLTTDLTTEVTRLEVPAYFLHGRHDRTVSYDLARAYARQLEAPAVGFYTFPHSAHSPAFEEPDLAQRILTEDVLPGTTALADPW